MSDHTCDYTGPDDCCYVCGTGRPPEPDSIEAKADALAEALDDLHRYSVNLVDGYAESPCEAKVRAALEAMGREVV